MVAYGESAARSFCGRIRPAHPAAREPAGPQRELAQLARVNINTVQRLRAGSSARLATIRRLARGNARPADEPAARGPGASLRFQRSLAYAHVGHATSGRRLPGDVRDATPGAEVIRCPADTHELATLLDRFVVQTATGFTLVLVPVDSPDDVTRRLSTRVDSAQRQRSVQRARASHLQARYAYGTGCANTPNARALRPNRRQRDVKTTRSVHARAPLRGLRGTPRRPRRAARLHRDARQSPRPVARPL